MKLWREEDPVIENNLTRVVSKGGMFLHQRNWWNLDHFIKALIAGYGSGKTLIGAKRAIALALHNAPSPHLVVSPSYKMAKRTVIPTIEALLSGKKSIHPDLWFKYHKTDHEFKIKWRGRKAFIWVASGDDPDSLRGPNIGSGWIDEPFIQEESVLTQLIARVRDPDSKRLEIGLTGTPESLNWGYDICEGERKSDFDVGIVHASTRSNLTLGNSYVSRLEGALTDVAAEAYISGNFINLTTGRIYYGFLKSRNVIELPDPGIEYHVGMDFNVDPMAAIVFWVSGNHAHIVDEIELPNADTEYMCKYLRDTYTFNKDHPQKGLCRIHKVFPDATGRARKTSATGGNTDFKIIENNGFLLDAPPSNPPIRDRENCVNGKLNPKVGKATLTISPRCKRLISYLEKYTQENKNKPSYKKMSHLLDSLGYPMHRIFPIHYESVNLANIKGF